MGVRKLKRKKKLKKKPVGTDAANTYFTVANEHKSLGRPEKAVLFYRKAIENNPDHAEALNNLGNTLHLLGRLPEALLYYEQACALLPQSPQAHYNYGTALYEAGHVDNAIAELTLVTSLSPRHSEAYGCLGVAYQAIGFLDNAQTALKKAIDLNPDYQEAHRFLGLVLKDQGDINSAKKQFRRTLDKWPEDTFTRYLLSRYTTYTSKEKADIPVLLSLLKKNDITNDDIIFLHFTLGKIYDDLGKFDKAFHHYSLGNKTKRATLGKRIISTGIDLKRIHAVFTPEFFSRFSSLGNDSEVPVFIIGMPRSGTTLVEQICASHSAVHGSGESKMIREIIENFKNYPECLSTLKPAEIIKLAESYIEKLRGDLPDNIIRITDKMPTNFIELGLIRILFPRARIIHCVRNAMDICLSNYFQNFEEGNECSFDLRELALYYRKYKMLMDFWKNILPGEIYEVEYEKLVDNFEQQSRQIIDFIGLPWEESCLSFFKSKRMVHTSSDYQVRQPIYTKSVERWKNYEQYLDTLKEELTSTSVLL